MKHDLITSSTQFQEDSINNLIYKGDQNDLEMYKNENRIICLDDDLLSVDIERRHKILREIIFKPLRLSNKICQDKTVHVKDEDHMLIEQLIKKIEKNGTNDENKFKCFVL
jgi:hypothetical protein